MRESPLDRDIMLGIRPRRATPEEMEEAERMQKLEQQRHNTEWKRDWRKVKDAAILSALIVLNPTHTASDTRVTHLIENPHNPFGRAGDFEQRSHATATPPVYHVPYCVPSDPFHPEAVPDNSGMWNNRGNGEVCEEYLGHENEILRP